MSGLVLVTGSSGRIGRAVVAELQARRLPVRGFDRTPTPDLADCVVGDVADAAAVDRALTDVTTLIHLAATPDDADFVTELLPNNILGVYHVLEAARRARVKRMILASSGQVVWYQRFRGPLPITAADLPTPRYWYAAGKAFLEAAGRAFAEKFGISVIAARLGWCPRTAEHIQELKVEEWGQDVYLSPADAGRFFACAVQAPGPIPFAIIYATSKPVHQVYYDLEPAATLLDYRPLDRWPDGCEVS
ncbi:MAG: NAD(P)-dependent oxidoreductase [Planctomycetes bacterium]|nr:NAD(P)-dependent oxidoreductase [Planctomycetota bacterium]